MASYGTAASGAKRPLPKYRVLQIANLRQSKVLLYGSTNLHTPQVIGCARLAKPDAGYHHDGICPLCKFLGKRSLCRAVNHFLVSVDVLGQDAVSTPQKAKLPGHPLIWRDGEDRDLRAFAGDAGCRRTACVDTGVG